MVWLKFLHIVTISIWSAGLVCLPGLYLQRAHVPNDESLHRLQGLVRFLYVTITSPAAFVAIGSGTALIFLRETFDPWFSTKLALVGVMVVIHALTGLVIVRLFEEGQIYPVWRFIAVTVATLIVISLVLFVVLAKPVLPNAFPAVFSEPGGLGRLYDAISPYPR